jgi:hypothetical protein
VECKALTPKQEAGASLTTDENASTPVQMQVEIDDVLPR